MWNFLLVALCQHSKCVRFLENFGFWIFGWGMLNPYHSHFVNGEIVV